MIGETVGNFEIVARLGRGGMGEVWLAEQHAVRTRVAIKLLTEDASADSQQVQRFFQEAVAVGKIRHTGIAKIFDVGVHASGRAYLVMEYLEGETLGRRIRRLGRLPFGKVVDYGRQVAGVLGATHAAGITHRDLKPDNIFLVPDVELAGGERVKLLDFGIAKLANVSITATSSAMGTPLYMSPEQWRNVAKVDARSDAYSLGCVMFEMACGRTPFLAASMGEACAQHLTDPPPAPSSIVDGLPDSFGNLVLGLLAKDPAQRPTMRDVTVALASLGDQPIAHDATLPQPVRIMGERGLDATQATGPQPAPQRDAGVPRRRIGVGVSIGAAIVIAGAAVFVATRTTTTVVTADGAIAPVDAMSLEIADAPPDSLDATTADARTPDARPMARDAVVADVPRDAPAHAPTFPTELSIRGSLAWINEPPRTAGVDPRIPHGVSIRLCIDTAGAVTHLSIMEPHVVPQDVEDEIIAKVSRWRYPTQPRPACMAHGLRAVAR